MKTEEQEKAANLHKLLCEFYTTELINSFEPENDNTLTLAIKVVLQDLFLKV